MACDTFIKIAGKCKKLFVMTQPGEVQPFIEEILAAITTIICDLETRQVMVFTKKLKKLELKKHRERTFKD